MDTPEKPKRTWWRKKRWRVVIAAWLLLPVAFPLSIGPALYCLHRGWIPGEGFDPSRRIIAFYRPVDSAVLGTPFAKPFNRWQVWWAELGSRHAEEAQADADPISN